MARIITILRGENPPRRWGIYGSRHALYFVNPHHRDARWLVRHGQELDTFLTAPPYNAEPRKFWWWDGSVLTLVDSATMLKHIEDVITDG